MRVTLDDVMEVACDICHYPYKLANQDDLDEVCESCPLEDLIKRYKEGANYGEKKQENGRM